MRFQKVWLRSFTAAFVSFSSYVVLSGILMSHRCAIRWAIFCTINSWLSVYANLFCRIMQCLLCPAYEQESRRAPCLNSECLNKKTNDFNRKENTNLLSLSLVISSWVSMGNQTFIKMRSQYQNFLQSSFSNGFSLWQYLFSHLRCDFIKPISCIQWNKVSIYSQINQNGM